MMNLNSPYGARSLSMAMVNGVRVFAICLGLLFATITAKAADADGDNFAGDDPVAEKVDCCDDGTEGALGCTPATAASINPGATDTPNDGIDQNCDGSDATAAADPLCDPAVVCKDEDEQASIIACAKNPDPNSRAYKLEVQGRESCKYAGGTYENCECKELPKDGRGLWWDGRTHVVRDVGDRAIMRTLANHEERITGLEQRVTEELDGTKQELAGLEKRVKDNEDATAALGDRQTANEEADSKRDEAIAANTQGVKDAKEEAKKAKTKADAAFITAQEADRRGLYLSLTPGLTALFQAKYSVPYCGDDICTPGQAADFTRKRMLRGNPEVGPSLTAGLGYGDFNRGFRVGGDVKLGVPFGKSDSVNPMTGRFNEKSVPGLLAELQFSGAKVFEGGFEIGGHAGGGVHNSGVHGSGDNVGGYLVGLGLDLAYNINSGTRRMGVSPILSLDFGANSFGTNLNGVPNDFWSPYGAVSLGVRVEHRPIADRVWNGRGK